MLGAMTYSKTFFEISLSRSLDLSLKRKKYKDNKLLGLNNSQKQLINSEI